MKSDKRKPAKADPKKKLTLKRERLRTLSNEQLDRVPGGHGGSDEGGTVMLTHTCGCALV
jgi:hypothetical protein